MHDRLMHDPDPIREVAPETPARLEAIICRALQRDPRRRYSSCFELARALENRETPVPGRENQPGKIRKPSSRLSLRALRRLCRV